MLLIFFKKKPAAERAAIFFEVLQSHDVLNVENKFDNVAFLASNDCDNHCFYFKLGSVGSFLFWPNVESGR